MPFQQYPMQSSELPPESMSPGGYPPSNGLPPDALMTLAGGGIPMQGAAAGGYDSAPTSGGPSGGEYGFGGGAGPGGMSQAPLAPPGTSEGMTPAGGMDPMAGIAGNPGADPMMAVKQQFDQVIGGLQALAQTYPMGTEEFQAAGEAVARGMLKVVQAVQPNPTMPPMPA